MSIRIIKAGLADAFYDKGRYGYQHLGINPGGAMHVAALQTANALVCNPPNEAVLEMHFPAANILFNQPALIALTGADFTATINQQPIPINTPIAVGKGVELKCTKPLSGARTYLSVSGGFALTPWLNSCSTNLVCHAGGFNGRTLQTGDVVNFKSPINLSPILTQKPFRILPFRASVHQLHHYQNIHILPGNHYPSLTQQSQQNLLSQTFTIAANSNRMGYRLHGTQLSLQHPTNIISSAVTKGTIQLLPSGQLIILMADHQTTGGYPVVGHVPSAFADTLAQCRPTQSIQFALTDFASAEAALISRHLHLLQLQNACTFRIKPFLTNANGRS